MIVREVIFFQLEQSGNIWKYPLSKLSDENLEAIIPRAGVSLKIQKFS